MEKAKLELVVGVFVLIGIVCLGYLSIKLGKLELIGGQYYEVEAEFDSVSGLKPGAAAEIAGVEVGRVKAIKLKEDRGFVTLSIRNDVTLYSDAFASIKTRGIIGEKFVSLSPGGGGEPVHAGSRIRNSSSASTSTAR
jgi:phospholipid/cholesterol/gamma-HCH transport system substrate-binding protein